MYRVTQCSRNISFQIPGSLNPTHILEYYFKIPSWKSEVWEMTGYLENYDTISLIQTFIQKTLHLTTIPFPESGIIRLDILPQSRYDYFDPLKIGVFCHGIVGKTYLLIPENFERFSVFPDIEKLF